MGEYLGPGVIVEETGCGPRPIEGVATGTVAFLGETERGPTGPHPIATFTEYLRWFGGDFGEDKFMPYALSGFFENGGRRAYVCRIVGADAVPANCTVVALYIEAAGAGLWGNRLSVKLTDRTKTGPISSPVGFHLQVYYWATPTADGQYPDLFEFGSVVTEPRPVTEDFDGLVLGDPTSLDHFIDRINANSALVKVSHAKSDGSDVQPLGLVTALFGGTAGAAPTPHDYMGENPTCDLRTGRSTCAEQLPRGFARRRTWRAGSCI